MNILKDKIVVITGSSSGIGKSCAFKFAAEGARLIISARRNERIESIAKKIKKEFQSDIYASTLDIRNQKQVETFFHKLPKDWKEIDVLVNNAGLSRGLEKLHEAATENWEEMIDTNIKGLLYVSRAVIPGMVQRNSGMIINIGSIAGHEVYVGGNVYCATKHAVDAITRGLRYDLVDTNIRVCTVDPGLVETEFSMVRFKGDLERAKNVYKGLTPLSPDDVAEAVVWCATRPPHVQVAQILLLPTSQASASLVNRKL